MEHKDYIEFAREKFLKEKVYGKYDYIDKIFNGNPDDYKTTNC